MDNINKNFSDIKDAFSILEGQDKLIHLIDLGKKIDKINMEDKKIPIKYMHVHLKPGSK